MICASTNPTWLKKETPRLLEIQNTLPGFKPSLRVTVTLKGFGQRPINGASILVNRTRSKQLFHTSQNRPSFCAFYWVTTFSSAKRVSGWPRGRNLGGVTGELRRLALTPQILNLVVETMYRTDTLYLNPSSGNRKTLKEICSLVNKGLLVKGKERVLYCYYIVNF